ncbi:hypothetical protein [Bradyrhizobium sp. DASA03007]|uniref:hypothetical protein n=1 Tax=unclassified Bradyrhizobium TaxID=2631580 RepID=UPI003F7089CC
MLRGGGWPATRCEAHAEGRPAVPVEEGLEDLHVDHHLVGGRWRVRYRFYDRAADRFVEAGRPEVTMARFECRACSVSGAWTYDSERFTCPVCDSIDVRFEVFRKSCRTTTPWPGGWTSWQDVGAAARRTGRWRNSAAPPAGAKANSNTTRTAAAMRSVGRRHDLTPGWLD